MSFLLATALLLQIKVGASVTRDSADTTHKKKKEVSVNISVGDDKSKKREAKRIPVTEQHLATAFKTPMARTLLLRARAARMSQDSALISYEATAYMRISAGMGFSRIGRDRLLFRQEQALEVKWHRNVGAWVDVKGARTAIPMAPKEAQEETTQEISSDMDVDMLPYYPGQEPLMSFNGSLVKSQVDEHDIVHPLAEGAEAYYTYEVGDSVTFRLPDGKVIELRELNVRPRITRWNSVVGSLWFDVSSGQLVRAAYRLSSPMDFWAVVAEQDSTAQDDIPVWVKPLISPMRGQIKAIAIEYGLYNGRFWLPRLNSAEGDAQVSFMHVPFKFEQSFKFSSVNALDSLPRITVVKRPQPPDSLSEDDREKWRDSVREVRRVVRRAQRDSVEKGLRKREPECDSTGYHLYTREAFDSAGFNIATRVPCDIASLEHSPLLPKSIFDDGEELFGSAERDALIKEALAMGAQPPFAIGAIPPTLKWGLEFTRFNRIEGLSTGALIEQPLGAGYTASLLGRIGIADLQPNAELTLARTNLTTTIRGRAYNRLVSASDWGNPLSFGSSLSALLFGRDEGFYYRASGAEMEWASEPATGGITSVRLFAEHQRTAKPENPNSLGARFIPNIVSRRGNYAGVATRLIRNVGLDPNGFRIYSDLRGESAVDDSTTTLFGRGALDLTVSDRVGPLAASVTVSGGSSFGVVPPQRLWYLGGTHSVRGFRPDTARAGNAYWLGRLEIGSQDVGVRPVIFGDIGWVGDRTKLSQVGRPLSGVGIGASFVDGLIRADLAKGINPTGRVRLDVYVEARF